MLNILLIEDNDDNADIMTQLLSHKGHKIHHVVNGLSGVEIVDKKPVDIALVDLGLPDVSGMSVIALIKRQLKDIPIVVVSARTDYPNWQEAINKGCVGYITKPIDVSTFSSTIEELHAEYPSNIK